MNTREESHNQEPELLVAGRGEWHLCGRRFRKGARCDCSAALTACMGHHVTAAAYPPATCRHGIPGIGAAPGGGHDAVRRDVPRVGGTQVRLRREGQLLLPHRPAKCGPHVSGCLLTQQAGGVGQITHQAGGVRQMARVSAAALAPGAPAYARSCPPASSHLPPSHLLVCSTPHFCCRLRCPWLQLRAGAAAV